MSAVDYPIPGSSTTKKQVQPANQTIPLHFGRDGNQVSFLCRPIGNQLCPNGPDEAGEAKQKGGTVVWQRNEARKHLLQHRPGIFGLKQTCPRNPVVPLLILCPFNERGLDSLSTWWAMCLSSPPAGWAGTLPYFSRSVYDAMLFSEPYSLTEAARRPRLFDLGGRTIRSRGTEDLGLGSSAKEKKKTSKKVDGRFRTFPVVAVCC